MIDGNDCYLALFGRSKRTYGLLTSNDLMDALYADYLYVLDNGRIAVEGDPIAVMREDKLFGRLNLELPFMVDLS